ncbi:hypothetical protein MTR67_052812 [Solanum verrucosum]|uniref:Uncharacterized protein n=1 Tax=Solanum verrucosum TaxID=315347 RepID=A0AAF0V7P3_SOLVR|nr:hypothetical protein MTR67_052812 [Solanum verrucosum]
MDNEIQKQKTNEDNLKSKASQQHDYKNAELRRSEDGKNPELKGDDGKLLKTHNITYHDKATQTETEEEDTIEKILKAITTLCTKVDSMDNEIQKQKTNEDNLKSKASQQHDYKNAELRRSEDGKNPELKGDDGKLLKTHNVCLNTAAVAHQGCPNVGSPLRATSQPLVKTTTRGDAFTSWWSSQGGQATSTRTMSGTMTSG